MGKRNRLIRPWRVAIVMLALALLVPAASRAGTPAATPVTIGFRVAPPYVIAPPDGRLKGLEYELVMAAAAAGGLAVTPDVAPYGRLPEDFRRGHIDAFTPAGAAMQLPGCLSDTVLTYQNIAFTLERNRLPINEIADLAYYDVMAFQNASRLLGPALLQAQRINTRYHEVANQMLQVRALFTGRTDVVIADRRIFRFLMHSSEAGVDTAAPLAEHVIFPPSDYGVAFRKPAACAAFNDGLRRIRGDGRYDAIRQSWEAALEAAGATPIRYHRPG
ncbi:substrate-binding periplasmic protein [Ferrovibrio xuzhouensis]|uniref:Substrate-binding periplasmic protein n=1 Tax=Ferrovibrio xuzhouensis TaxID=1576914 RepID=A0ABV7VEY0_9PROT